MTAPHRILLIAPDLPVYQIGVIEDGQVLGRVGNELVGVDAPPPGAHATAHENGGADEITVAGLSGVLADPQPPIIGGGAAQAVAGNDARLTDARTPTAHDHNGVYEPANANIQAHVVAAHAPSNAQKNSDITIAEIEAKLVGEIASHTHAAAAVPKLDDLAPPDDNTELNASLTAHGLLLKLTGSTTVFLRADGTWSTPTASIAAPFVGDQAPGSFTVATEKFGLQGKRLTLTGAQRGTLEGTGRLLILG